MQLHHLSALIALLALNNFPRPPRSLSIRNIISHLDPEEFFSLAFKFFAPGFACGKAAAKGKRSLEALELLKKWIGLGTGSESGNSVTTTNWEDSELKVLISEE